MGSQIFESGLWGRRHGKGGCGIISEGMSGAQTHELAKGVSADGEGERAEH